MKHLAQRSLPQELAEFAQLHIYQLTKLDMFIKAMLSLEASATPITLWLDSLSSLTLWKWLALWNRLVLWNWLVLWNRFALCDFVGMLELSVFIQIHTASKPSITLDAEAAGFC
jgi:hypothetical protein